MTLKSLNKSSPTYKHQLTSAQNANPPEKACNLQRLTLSGPLLHRMADLLKRETLEGSEVALWFRLWATAKADELDSRICFSCLWQ